MIRYSLAKTEQELQKILDLQCRNYKEALSPIEMQEEGFLSLTHDLAALKAISGPYYHIIAKDEDKVAGFALVMLKDFRNAVPVLVPMFEELDALGFQGKKLKDISYFVMGQICVGKDYRGQGVFKGLYRKLREEMRDEFDVVVTEVATRNIRSMNAHTAAGFRLLKTYVSPEKEEWAIVLWDWQ